MQLVGRDFTIWAHFRGQRSRFNSTFNLKIFLLMKKQQLQLTELSLRRKKGVLSHNDMAPRKRKKVSGGVFSKDIAMQYCSVYSITKHL